MKKKIRNWKQVAHILVTTAFLEEMMVVKLVTTLLSTRLGTLLLSGFLCISHKWPYIHKFSEISLHKREKILQKWFKNGYISPIRLGLLLIKSICLLVFFSQVISSSSFSLLASCSQIKNK